MRKSFNAVVTFYFKNTTSFSTISMLKDLNDMENASNARYDFDIIKGT